jgi:glutamyl-tRNA synthetase
MPLTLKPDGQGKLSKRDGDRLGFPVFPLAWTQPETGEISSGYRESGYFPEAFINILAFLGWNPGTEQEIFSMDELIEAFSLDRIVKAGSRFDPEKAKWFNHQYMVKKRSDELAEWFTGELEQRDLQFEASYISKALGLVKERAFLLTDLWEQSWFLFQAPSDYDEKVMRKVWKEDSDVLLGELYESFELVEPFTAGMIEPVVKNLAERLGIVFGKLMNPLRLSLVGSNIGPGLMDMMEVLGKEEVLQRIKKAIQSIK